LSWDGFDANLPAHSLNSFPNKRKANASSFICHWMDSLEYFEQTLSRVNIYSDAIVFHPYPHLVILSFIIHANTWLNTRRDKLYRVLQQIRQALR
jgi:hypothetical protein